MLTICEGSAAGDLALTPDLRQDWPIDRSILVLCNDAVKLSNRGRTMRQESTVWQTASLGIIAVALTDRGG
jgi:hypothetical protein